MKYFILSIMVLITACSEQTENENKQPVLTPEQIKNIRSKPFNELTDKEKAVLIMMMDSKQKNNPHSTEN
ncbi:MAG: hypothetical protein CFH44_00339 [Proteobacteria bacterium]|nr:MAG: hypothetical protein CFH44_00339 [Pseudomonadota bacterium]|tara:strand:+ start:1385 stop:1594 length:210 start_codon:yes stop_codon:yes gene_type:complete